MELDLYGQLLQIDLCNAASIGAFMQRLDEQILLPAETKAAVALKVAHHLHELGITCPQLLRQALRRYEQTFLQWMIIGMRV